MAMTLVSTVTLTTNASGITFSNIPQTGKDLLVLVSARTNASAQFTTGSVDVNSTDGTSRVLSGSGSAAASNSETQKIAMDHNGNTATSNTFSNSQAYIANYTSTTAKSVSVDSVTENNATAARMSIAAGISNNTSAMTSLEISGFGSNLLTGSTASLYIIS